MNKRYGGTLALDGASLDVRGGEWLAPLRPNGAGKTTMTEILATLFFRWHPRDGG